MQHDDKLLDQDHIRKLTRGVSNNNPELLPSFFTANQKRRVYKRLGVVLAPGETYSEAPALRMPARFDAVARQIGNKMARGLYYKHVGKVVPGNRLINLGWHQEANPDGSHLLQRFVELLPARILPSRRNLKDYGHRFAYAYGTNDEEGIFAFLCIFGDGGLIIYGWVHPVDLADA